MSKIRAFFADRRKVLISAAVLGGGFGVLALARRGGSSAASDAPAIEPGAQLVAGSATPYNFDGIDAAMVDSQNASAIVEQIGSLTTNVANLEGSVGTLFGLIDQAQGTTAAPPQPAAPQPTQPQPTQPKPATPRPQGSPLPRWTPPSGARIGGPTDMKGVTFAGRVKLSNGQYAPIVKYASGTSQIHPEWQKWMAANNVRKVG